MTTEVTVVVPVYNPGRYLVACIESLLAQSVPVDRREYIFIDDGSTDESPELLDRVASEHPDVHVIHQPNSGWPGKPRNVGIDAARGEYVFFSDHDDTLYPEALERMVAMARRTGADVLIPKMVSQGRPIPRRIFRHNIERADLVADDVMKALTPHKLFRRALLSEHSLRFPEGKRRLEDHVFVTEAYLHAGVISVLADYPCYVRMRREDDGNAALQAWEPDYYYRFVGEVIDVIEANTEPGEFRNALLMRPYGGEMVGKIVGKGWRRWDRPTRRQIFSEVRSLMVSRFPPDFHERLPIVRRAHAQALLADRPERFASIAGTSAAAGPEAALQRLIWNTDRWVAHIEAEVTHGDGSPIRLIPMANDGWAIDSWLIPTDLAAAPYELGDILASEFDVEVVDRESGVTWYLPVELPPELVPIDGDPQGAQRLVFRGTLEIDPMTLAGGTPLPPATWDLRVRLEVLGMSRNCRVRYRPAPDAPPLAPAVFEDRLIVTPYISPKAENLGFEIVEATHVSGPTL